MDKLSLIRTIVLLIALTNQLLVAYGVSPLPIEDGQVETIVSTLVTVVVALIAWWKNNYISERGRKQKEVLKKEGLYKP